MKTLMTLAAILLSAGMAEARHFSMPIIISTGGGGVPSNVKTTLSGKPIKVSFWREINPDCTTVSGFLVRLSQTPEHGRANLTKGSDFPGYRSTDVRAACNKRRVHGTLINYVSQRGFVGTDYFTVEVFTATGNHQTRRYTINVK